MLNNQQNIKLGIIGDGSTQFIHMATYQYFKKMNKELDIFEGEFDQIDLLIMNKSSALYEFSPEYILLYISSEKLLESFVVLDDECKSRFAEQIIAKIKIYWQNVKDVKIIQMNFALIQQSIYGNQSAKINTSFEYQLRKLNVLLADLAAKMNVFLLDFDALQSMEGRKNTHNLMQYYMGKVTLSTDYVDVIAKNLYDIIFASKGYIKKCVILDLDNTLWGGVIGDDGLDKIQIGELGIGRVYSDIQTYFKQLKKRGIILCICSKNEESIAKQPFENHPDMVLQLDDISVFVANWNDKASNIRYIKKVLNIGYESIIFVDDNSFERNLVESMLPEVEVVHLPDDPAKYLEYITSQNLFETTTISKEDNKRTKMYQQEAKRVMSKSSFKSTDDYLKSLKMKAETCGISNFDIPRISQLTQRSNQFNLRTKRYTENDIQEMVNSDEYKVIKFSLNDVYGSHGLIGIVILKKLDTDKVFIDTFIMSCRVLKRGMEEYISNKIVDISKESGYKQIFAEYIMTEKNIMVKQLYDNFGYKKTDDNTYVLNINEYKNFDCVIN